LSDLRRRKKGPRRIDEDYSFKPESLDERIYNAIKVENSEQCVFSNIITDGSISISGRNNVLRNSYVIEPGRVSISGQDNILQNVRRLRRSK